MTTHELARRLLELPNMPVYTRNQTYDETTYSEVDLLEETDLVVSDTGGDTYAADYFLPPLKDAETVKGLVIL